MTETAGLPIVPEVSLKMPPHAVNAKGKSMSIYIMSTYFNKSVWLARSPLLPHGTALIIN